jgi:hypothetical protein
MRAGFPWRPLLVLSLAAMCFVAALAEIALRLAALPASGAVALQCFGAGTVLSGQKGLFRLDADSGFAMRPDTCVHLRSSEYDQVLRTNRHGFVGPDVPEPKPAGEFRIVVLGDSYTAGGQVPYEQNYTAVLERSLRSAGYANVRVIDAGVGGCGTYCQAGVLRENISWMQPNLVVVAVFVGNNIAENVLAVHGGYRDAPEHPKGVTWAPAAGQLLDESRGWFRGNRAPPEVMPPPWDPGQPLPAPVGNAPSGTPPYAPSDAGSVPAGSTLGRVHQEAVAVWNGARSHSLLLGNVFGEPIDPSVTTAPGALPAGHQRLTLNLATFEWLLLREPPRTYWLDVAWPLFGAYLADIRATAASAEAPTVVMAIPQLGQFDDAARQRAMADFQLTNDALDWDRPQWELRVEAQAAGVAVLDLLPVFRGSADRVDLYFPLDTHFTAVGHRVVASALAEYLQGSGLLPVASAGPDVHVPSQH